LIKVLQDHNQEHPLCAQDELIVEVVSERFVEVWPTFRKVSPYFFKEINLVLPMQWVDLIADA
jgi:hypothetical protein